MLRPNGHWLARLEHAPSRGWRASMCMQISATRSGAPCAAPQVRSAHRGRRAPASGGPIFDLLKHGRLTGLHGLPHPPEAEPDGGDWQSQVFRSGL